MTEVRRPRGARRLEANIVIALSRTPLSEKSRSLVMQWIPEGVDWTELLQLAARWRVEPMILENLRSGFVQSLPPSVRARIEERDRDLRAVTLQKVAGFLRLAGDFESAGIPVIVLKGPALALSAYGAYSRRSFDDTDILVRRADLARARDTLLSRGYSADYARDTELGLVEDGHALEFSGEWGIVELHWSLFPRQLRLDLDTDEIWSGALPIEGLGATAMHMPREHGLLYLCAHGAKHQWEPLRWITDVAQLAVQLTTADAERIAELAERHNARRILALALRIVRRLFPDDISRFPERALDAYRGDGRLLRFVAARIDSQPENPGLLPAWLGSMHQYIEPLAFWMAARERKRDRIASAMYMLKRAIR